MIKTPVAALLLLFVATAGFAQSRAPLKPATDPSPEDLRRIETATALHDQGKFDEAIAQYQEILNATPANMPALYELAFSYLGKKESAKAREAAERGTEYASELRPMFYDLIAESYDAEGHPDDAIRA